MIEKDIQQYLQAQTPLTTAIGGPQKIYPIQAPTGAGETSRIRTRWVIQSPRAGVTKALTYMAN